MSYEHKGYVVRCHATYADRWLFMSPSNGHRIYGLSGDIARREVIKYAERYFQRNRI